ncbi:MAG: hypothetical protein A2078_02085 [Nitrospirae bacterium GWC2_57_9]|nr:MAG: hypothetical protein A2078_02085 [Nitrospirae bacterium GWC2_57_9]
MRKMAALFFILVLATGSAWADWESSWANEKVQNTGKMTGNTPAEVTAGEPKEAIAGERPRDENAPAEIPAEAPSQPVEEGGTDTKQ